jgi:hypothetical protein
VDSGFDEIVLVGIRGGCLLTWELLKAARRSYRAAVLWQPVISGTSVITDLLRMRIAANALSDSRESLSALRQRLGAGAAVETAGYAITPGLYRALETCAIEPCGRPMPPIVWIEFSTEGSRAAARTAIDRLTTSGLRVTVFHETDPHIWSTTETTVAPMAVARTVQAIAQLTS